MGGSQLGAIVEFPTRRALPLPLPAVPGGEAVLDAAVWDRWRSSRCRDVLTRTGRQQTGNKQAAQQRTHLCLPKKGGETDKGLERELCNRDACT